MKCSQSLLRAVILGVLLFAETGCAVWPGLPDVAQLKTRYPVVRLIRKEPDKDVVIVTLERKRPSDWVRLSAISRDAVHAILISEDWAFYQHHGFDLNQIRLALKKDIDAGHFARGASTITQQVARNVFLDQDKNLFRKIKELVLAVRLERKLTKNRILEIYLNIAEWGDGIFGIGSASRYYFKKEPSELTVKEGAFLAMLLPSPKRYSESFRARQLTEYARDTIEDILDKLVQAHYITDEKRNAALAAPLPFEPDSEPDAGSPSPNPSPSVPGLPPSGEAETFLDRQDRCVMI